MTSAVLPALTRPAFTRKAQTDPRRPVIPARSRAAAADGNRSPRASRRRKAAPGLRCNSTSSRGSSSSTRARCTPRQPPAGTRRVGGRTASAPARRCRILAGLAPPPPAAPGPATGADGRRVPPAPGRETPRGRARLTWRLRCGPRAAGTVSTATAAAGSSGRHRPRAAVLRTRQSPRAPARPRGGADGGTRRYAHARRPPAAESRIFHSGQWEPLAGAGTARWVASPAGMHEAGERRGAAPLGCEVTSSCLRCRQVGEIEHCCRSRRRALLCYLHPPRVGWGAMRNQSNNGGRAASAFLQSSCSASCVTGLGSGYQRFRCCARGERIASSYLHCSLLSFSSLSPQHRTHTISAQPPARIHGTAPKQPHRPKKAGPTRNCIEYTVIPTSSLMDFNPCTN